MGCQKFGCSLVVAMALSCASGLGHGQEAGHRPLNLRIPSDVLRGDARPTDRRAIPIAPEVRWYQAQLMDRLMAIVNGNLRANPLMCGEMDITVLINADGSVRDVQFPGKAFGIHSDPSGMLETALREALINVKSFPVAPEALQRDPNFRNYVLNNRIGRRCRVRPAL